MALWRPAIAPEITFEGRPGDESKGEPWLVVDESQQALFDKITAAGLKVQEIEKRLPAEAKQREVTMFADGFELITDEGGNPVGVIQPVPLNYRLDGDEVKADLSHIEDAKALADYEAIVSAAQSKP